MRRSFPGIAIVALPVAALLLVATPQAQSDRALQASRNHFSANPTAYGVADPASDLRLRSRRTDARGVSHLRFDQTYRGLPVFEGEAIAHVEADGAVEVTNSLRARLAVDPTPRVTRQAAVQTAVRGISPLGAYELRDASLWVLPRGDRSLVDRLAWHVAVLVENEFEPTAEWQYFIDAHSGDVAFAFNGLETANVVGTGRTMYAGTQSLNVDQTAATTFYLRDPTKGGTFTCDMRNGTRSCYYVTGTSSTFGTGTISTTGVNAAVDAQFGLQATWAYYQSMFGRNGIDGKGTKAYSRVHYGKNYENAFWSNSCFCMTYGDGATTFYPLVSLDVAAHEVSHGVMSTEANLTYSGESGGLNESNSDIFGALVEFAVNSPNDPPDYLVGEEIFKSNYVNGVLTGSRALRYMHNPALDGRSPACWSSSLGSIDVHYSSGPNNLMFYLLSNGGTSACNGQVVTGIGRDKAARIWYKAVADYMTASTTYAGARTATLSAASNLYGSTSAEYAAVAAAYRAINVN